MMKCYGCGKDIHETAQCCPSCGAVVQKTLIIGKKNRIAAALLAFFLGGFGVHKFYLGRIFQGFLYLIFCWTFIPSIISFIEFIIYLFMSDERFEQKYG